MASLRRRSGRRWGRTAERVALGAIMSVVAFVVERRLMKVLHRRGEEAAAETGGREDVELSASPDEVQQ